MPENDNTPFFLKIFGTAFVIAGMVICLYSFWQMSASVENSLVLTGYFVSLPVGSEKSFGYGGDKPDEKVDVLLQGKEMSNRAFKISRQSAEVLTVIPIDDRIRFKQKWYGKNEKETSFQITEGQVFRTQGILGGAGFRVKFDSLKNELRLILINPIYRSLSNSSQTRLIFDSQFSPLPVSKDEIYFRSGFEQRQNSYIIQNITETELQLQPDPDLAFDDVEATEQITITSNEPKDIGNLTLEYSSISASAVRFYGVKLCLGILLLGLAYQFGPQVKFPQGILIFGIVVFLLSLGLVLAARDFFFGPHVERFVTYIGVAFWCAVCLFGLRYPHDENTEQPDDPNSDTGSWGGIILSGICITLAYCSFYQNFSTSSVFSLSSFFPGFIGLITVIVGYVLVLLISGIFYLIVRRFIEELSKPVIENKITGAIIILLLLPIVFCLIAWLSGYQIMLGVPVLGRVYLPILMLPFIIIGTVLSSYISENSNFAGSSYLKWVCLLLVGGTITLYRLNTGDNGGTFIISAGWLAASFFIMKSRFIPFFLAFLLIVGAIFALSSSERFDLAWRPDEAQVSYYNQAKNLRVARDMARAGEWTGQWFSLRIPGDVRNNIHNDLVSAYLAGFYGWIILGFVIAAYILFYLSLWGNLNDFLQTSNNDYSIEPVNGIRVILAAVLGAILLTFLAQCLWVFIQPMQSLLPLIGLDLPLVSNSGSSVLSFLVIVLGANVICLTIRQSLNK